MASELSSLIERELERVDAKEEHQRRLSSLRIRVCRQLHGLLSILRESVLPKSAGGARRRQTGRSRLRLQ